MTALVAEDIRSEANGKLFAVGIYSSGIRFTQLPLIASRLQFLFGLRWLTPGDHRVTFELREQDTNREIAKGEMDLSVDVSSETSIVAFSFSPVDFQVAGDHPYVLSIDGQPIYDCLFEVIEPSGSDKRLT